MIALKLTLTNGEKVDETLSVVSNKPWALRESVLISSISKTVPELLEEAKKVIAARPGIYTFASVSAELLKNDSLFTLGDYWAEPLEFAIDESNGKISFIGVNNEIRA